MTINWLIAQIWHLIFNYIYHKSIYKFMKEKSTHKHIENSSSTGNFWTYASK
jgi:hypothetical protein